MNINKQLKLVSYLMDYLYVSDDTKKQFTNIIEEILDMFDENSKEIQELSVHFSHIYNEAIKTFKISTTMQMIRELPVKMYVHLLREMSSKLEHPDGHKCTNLSDGTYLSFDKTGVVNAFLNLESRNSVELLGLIHKHFPDIDQIPFNALLEELKLEDIKSPDVRRFVVFFYKLYDLKIYYINILVSSNLTDDDFKKFDSKLKRIDVLINHISDFIKTRDDKLILLVDKLFRQEDFGPVLIKN